MPKWGDRFTEAHLQAYYARQNRTPPSRTASPAHKDIPESKLLAHVREQASVNGWLMYHTYDSRRSEPGFPDVVAVRPNVVLFSELKRETEKPTMEQVVWADMIQRVERIDYRLWRPSDMDEITRYFHGTT